jgi:hypothetical protein
MKNVIDVALTKIYPNDSSDATFNFILKKTNIFPYLLDKLNKQQPSVSFDKHLLAQKVLEATFEKD